MYLIIFVKMVMSFVWVLKVLKKEGVFGGGVSIVLFVMYLLFILVGMGWLILLLWSKRGNFKIVEM